METAILGRTGLRVSRLGAGLFEIGRYPVDEPQHAERILNSEELIGNAVPHRRDEYVLATKAGHVPQGMSAEGVPDCLEQYQDLLPSGGG